MQWPNNIQRLVLSGVVIEGEITHTASGRTMPLENLKVCSMAGGGHLRGVPPSWSLHPTITTTTKKSGSKAPEFFIKGQFYPGFGIL